MLSHVSQEVWAGHGHWAMHHPQELPDSQLCCRQGRGAALRALHPTGKSRVQILSSKHRLLTFLLVPGSSLALGHAAQSMAEGGQAAERAGEVCCISHTGLCLFGLGVPQEQPWVFISYLPLSPGVRDSDCLLEAKYPQPGHFLEDGLARSSAGVGHTRQVVMSNLHT